MKSLLRPAWERVWQSLFRPETGLFYDYLSDLPDLGHLPTPEEIARCFPNPCGWGTGMEDGMLSAGAAMDILRLRRELGGDPDAGEMAEAVLSGICRAATVHGTPGFLARSVSPKDGRSCYLNSSRDQFTLGVYGAWRFLRHFPDAASAARDAVCELLASVARYCEKVVTPENRYDLLRWSPRSGTPRRTKCSGSRCSTRRRGRRPATNTGANSPSGTPSPASPRR